MRYPLKFACAVVALLLCNLTLQSTPACVKSAEETNREIKQLYSGGIVATMVDMNLPDAGSAVWNGCVHRRTLTQAKTKTGSGDAT